ncbi:hypothetical protein BKA93DRAFT_741965, partial [Sparassis latifolia]
PSIVPLLSRALHHIRLTPPRVIASPATQPRRAAVALIVRVVPPPSYAPRPVSAAQPDPVAAADPSAPSSSPTNVPTPSLSEFFELDWVKAPGARPEILFLRRDTPDSGDAGRLSGSGPRTREAHVAFPGGKTEESDEGGLYTAMRQTWEEIGLDLAESAYTPIGQLDDREVTTSLGKRLLMVLSPFVFLQLAPQTTAVDPVAGTTLHWVPIAELLPLGGDGEPRPRWSSVSVDASSRLAPRHSTLLRLLMRILVGSMQFPAILISPSSSSASLSPSPSKDTAKAIDAKRAHVEAGAANGTLRKRNSLPGLSRVRELERTQLKLWGLSLGMTLDLLVHMASDDRALVALNASELLPPDALMAMGVPVVAPSLASVFPRFSYPDVNFWIWVFAKRYRAVIRGWEASARAGGTNDRRMNWTGSALTTFYAAVRKALVVVLVLRALGVLVALVLGTWILFW